MASLSRWVFSGWFRVCSIDGAHRCKQMLSESSTLGNPGKCYRVASEHNPRAPFKTWQAPRGHFRLFVFQPFCSHERLVGWDWPPLLTPWPHGGSSLITLFEWEFFRCSCRNWLDRNLFSTTHPLPGGVVTWGWVSHSLETEQISISEARYDSLP